MYDYTTDRDSRRNKLWGAIFTALYCMVFAALFLWGSLHIEASEAVQRGMVVDFGIEEDAGSGADDTTLADQTPLPEPDHTPADPEPVVAQEIEEAPVVEKRNPEENPKSSEEQQQATEQKVDDVEPAPREVNSRAMFPGNKPDSQAASQGEAGGEGNQGSMNGTESDNYEGTGGDEGFEPDWSLEGRTPRGEFPRPRYAATEHGLVVVEIWVDNTGTVTHAEYRAKGSTVSIKSPLVGEAVKAARGMKFNESDNNQDIQVGTITYSFNLNTKPRQ